MPVDATTALLTGIRAALIADPLVMALVGSRIYSFAPAHHEAPSVTLSSVVTDDFSTSDTYGQEYFVDIHTWSKVDTGDDGDDPLLPALSMNFISDAYFLTSPSITTSRALVGSLYSLLHDGEINVAGHNLILLRVDGTRMLRDPDEQIRHGIVTVRALIGHS